MSFMIQNGVLIRFEGTDSEVVVPDGVTAIGQRAFFAFPSNKTLRSVVIPEGVEEIGKEAFYECVNLERVVFPSTLKRIGEKAFSGCVSAVDFQIPEGVELLGNLVFESCRGIAGSDGFAVYDHTVYGYFGADESAETPHGATKIATFGCHYPKNLVLGDDVTEIMPDALAGCAFSSLVLSHAITEIGYHAFHQTRIGSQYQDRIAMVIPSTVKTVRNKAFENASGTISIESPETQIENGAFPAYELVVKTDLTVSKTISPQIAKTMDMWSLKTAEEFACLIFYQSGKMWDSVLDENISYMNRRKTQIGWEEIASKLCGLISSEAVKKPRGKRIAEYVCHAGAYKQDPLTPKQVADIWSALKHKCPEAAEIIEKDPIWSQAVAFISEEQRAALVETESEKLPKENAPSSEMEKELTEMISALKDRYKETESKPWNLMDLRRENQDLSLGNLPYYIRKIKNVPPLDYLKEQGILQKSKYDDAVCPVKKIPQGTKEFSVFDIEHGFGKVGNADLPDSVSMITGCYLTGFGRCTTNGIRINIPEGYLQRTTSLPVESTRGLLNDRDGWCYGAWRDEATARDWAAIWLYQGKKLQELAAEAITINLTESVRELLWLLKKNGNAKQILAATQLVCNNRMSLPEDLFEEFRSFVNASKSKEAKQLMEETQSTNAHDTVHPLETLVKENWNPTPETDSLLKVIESGVRYSDSDDICSREAVAFIIGAYDAMVEQSYNKKDYSKYWGITINKPADEAAALISHADFLALLEQKALREEDPRFFGAFGRYGNEEQAGRMISRISDWREWSRYGAKGRALAEKAWTALLFSDTRKAMLQFDKEKQLRLYAQVRNMDEDAIRDNCLSDVGLDKNRCKTYDLGNQTVTVRLMKDLSLTVELPDAKTSKSLPKKGADPDKFEAANADFSEMKKAVKQIVKNRANILFEDFLSSRERKAESWKASYLVNPLLRDVASLIVWAQGDNTFTLTDEGPADSAGQTYEITDELISVAYPSKMKAEEVAAWQKYFTAHGLKQPFLQIWEPVRNLNEIREDRYKGCMIPFYRFKGQEKHGITVEDMDFHSIIHVSFRDCDAVVQRIDWERHAINMDDRFEVEKIFIQNATRFANHIIAYLDRITVWERVKKDDPGIGEMLEGFTLAQITEFIKVAQEANAVNVLAMLLNYKKNNFSGFDPMEEFILEG